MDKELAEVKQGEEAERLLDSPVYKSAVSAVRDGIVTSMTTSALGDSSTHNKLVIALQLLDQIERQIKDVVQTGKLAKLQIKEKKRLFG